MESKTTRIRFNQITLIITIIIIGVIVVSFQEDGYKLNKPSFSAKIIRPNEASDNVIYIDVNIKNNTLKPITFLSYLCAWQSVFTINTKQLNIQSAICAKEDLTTITIQPNKSYTRELSIESNNVQSKELKFRIGFRFVTPKDSIQSIQPLILEEEKELYSMENIIWSDTLEVK